MLRHAKKLEGYELRASDGRIGHVSDFFFDVRRWIARYLVVETGTWLESRKVLIVPSALGMAEWESRVLPVNLTRDQVRHSPPLDASLPVTREHESALMQYYNWPAYWTMAGFPEVGFTLPVVPPSFAPAEPARPADASALPPGERAQAQQLRSVRAVTGYAIEARDGEIGHVDDFLLDDRTWEIRYLIVDTRNFLPGKKVIVAPEWIRDVGWEQARVCVDLPRAAIKDSPPYDPAEIVTPDYAGRLHDHYGQPRHGSG